VYKVKTGLYYKPGYLGRNKYYEIELLENFSKFAVYSPLVDEYFLYYKKESFLYRGSGSTIEPDVFMEELADSSHTGIWEKVLSIEYTSLFFSGSEEETFLFFIFPIKILNATAAYDSNEAILGFIIREDTLKKRIGVLTGLDDTPLLVLYKNEFLMDLFGTSKNIKGPFSLDAPTRDKLIKNKIFSAQTDSSFTLLMDRGEAESNKLVRSYRDTLMLVIAVVFLALCGMGIYLAYRNYKPIKHLESSVGGGGTMAGNAEDELKNIESAFLRIRQKENHNHRLIQSQFNSLRRQMADIIMGGGYNNAVQSKAWEMGMVLEGPFFLVLAIKIKGSFSKTDEVDLWGMIETIHIPGIPVYCGSLGADGSFSVLMDLGSDHSRRELAARFFCQECRARGIELYAGAGPVIKNTARIGNVLLEAHKALQKSITGKVELVFSEETAEGYEYIINGENWADKLSRALKKNQQDEVSAVLDKIAVYLSEQAASIIYNRFVYYNVLSIMINAAREMKATILQEQISEVLKADSPEDFKRKALIISEHLCSVESARNNEVSMVPIMEYIRLHCCDYGISLEILHEQFGFNISQLSRMINKYTGESFRSCIANLRMEKAKELLKTDATIGEISAKVGYGSVSHFIKTFKAYYGKKPTSFRSQDAGQG
jgi:AraC-like DNA-binding protein